MPVLLDQHHVAGFVHGDNSHRAIVLDDLTQRGPTPGITTSSMRTVAIFPSNATRLAATEKISGAVTVRPLPPRAQR